MSRDCLDMGTSENDQEHSEKMLSGYSQDGFSQFGQLWEGMDNLEPASFSGIAATDLSSLLEQFEEASQTINFPEAQIPPSVPDALCSQSRQPQEVKMSNSVPKPPDPLPEAVLDKIRSARKRKSAIMLPLVNMPTKRGQRKVAALTRNVSPLKAQEVTIQTPGPAGSDELNCKSNLKSTKNVGKENTEVNDNYYDFIVDHDYCTNSPKLIQEREVEICDKSSSGFSFTSDNQSLDFVSEITVKTEDVSVTSDMLAKPDQLVSTELEDGEVLADTDSECELTRRQLSGTKDISSVHHSSETSRDCDCMPVADSDLFNPRTSRSRRNYRNRREESPINGTEKYFDKIPSYYTALSIAAKPPKKAKLSLYSSGITVQDYIARDPSPKHNENQLFDKVPAYFSCFTNSTKYDGGSSQDKQILDDLEQYPCDLTYSKPTCSRSHSRSSSRSKSASRSRSRSHSRSRSQSQHRRRRGRSYSSESGSSSSRSRSRSCTSSSSCSSRSRSRSPPHSKSKHNRYRSRSRSFETSRQRKRRHDSDKRQQIEERRIVYVGQIPDGYTRKELKKRFERFGEIDEVSVHFRECGDNYGFVTFAYTCDAYAAIEKGNDIPGEQHFDMCFGGRRQFCDTEYADLDGNAEAEEEFPKLIGSSSGLDFDQLLKQAQQKIRKKY